MSALFSAVQSLIRVYHEYWSQSTPKYQNDSMEVETWPEKHAEHAHENDSDEDEQMEVDLDSNESDELCEETHQREPEIKDQEWLSRLETGPFYPNKLFFKNVGPWVTTELLINYLENITGQDCVELLYSNEPGDVLTTFKTEINFVKVKQKCQTKLLNERQLEVWRVPVSNSILVENLSPDTHPEHVFCYFETPRAKGGTVLAVKQVQDRTKCVVCFENEKATDGVLNASHRLGGRELRVSLYLECLGPSGGRTEPYVFVPPAPVELTEADDLKVCFLRHSADILQCFNDRLSQVHAYATIVENILKVNCTITESMHSVHFLAETWRKNVKKQLMTCLGSVRLQRINVPPEVWEEVRIAVEECGVSYGDLVLTRKEEKDFLVLGRSSTKGDTFEKIQSIVKVKQEEYEIRKHIVNNTTKLKRHQLDLVKSSSFLSDLGTQDGRHRVDIGFQDEEITFQGHLTAIREAQVRMYNVINAVFSMAVTTIPDCQQRLLATDKSHEAVRKKLTTADLAAAWECYNEGVVVVYSLKEPCLKQASYLIQTSFKSETIFVKESSSSILKTCEWKSFKEKLLEENCGLLTITTDARTIFITAFCDIVVAVKEEVRKFVSENTLYSTVVKLSPSRLKFVALFWEDKLAIIASSLKVQITLQDDKKDILVRGTKKGIELAKRELSSLEEQIICTEEVITRKETVTYLADLKNTSTLDALAYTCKCVLSLHPESQMVPTDQPSLSPPKVHALLKDITQLSVDVIVNAANERMDHAGGLARQIVLTGGRVIQEECYNILKTRGSLSEGDVLVSGPGKLPCKSIIHAVGPRYKGGNKGEEECLRATVLECLKTTSDLGYTSIAFPAISSGIFGYPVREATRVIVEAVQSFFRTNTDSSISDVQLVDILLRTVRDFENALEGASNERLSTDRKTDVPALVLFTPGGEHKKRTIVSTIIQDISLLKVDALVIGANTGMFHFGDLAKIIEMKQECHHILKTKGELSEGDVLVLGSGKLPFKSIIHTVGPRLKDGDEGEEEWIRATVARCLETASDRGYTSIALPAISSRPFVSCAKKAGRVIVDALKVFFNTNQDSSVTDVRLIDGFSHNVQEFERLLSSGSLESSSVPASLPEPSPAPGAASSSEPSDWTILSGNQSLESQSEAEVATQQTDDTTVNPVHEVTSLTDGLASNASMSALAGDITQLSVDAIVNPINKDLDLCGSYRLAKRVVETGGTEIQEECHRLLQDKGEMSEGDVLVSGPGKLPCKSIIHAVIPKYAEDDKLEEIMRAIVVKCLETASERGYTSIALPHLTSASWVLNYPDKLAARATVKAVRGFLATNPDSSIKKVTFCDTLSQAVTEFRAAITDSPVVKQAWILGTYQAVDDAECLTWSTTPTNQKYGAMRPALKTVTATTPMGFGKTVNTSLSPWTLFGTLAATPGPGGKVHGLILCGIHVTIKQGDITEETAEAIVNSTNSKMDLSRGAISNVLRTKCGPELQQECETKLSDMAERKVVATAAYKLRSSYILHIDAEHYRALGNWEDAYTDILKEAENIGLQSIALPAIGTGGLGLSFTDSARALGRALITHSRDTKIATAVTVVLFDAAIIGDFTDTLTQMGATREAAQATNSHWSNVSDRLYPILSTEEEYTGQLEARTVPKVCKLYSFAANQDKRVKLQEALNKFVDGQVVEIKVQDFDALPSEKFMALCKKHDVRLLKRDTDATVKGLPKNVRLLLREKKCMVEKIKRQQQESLTANLVQWYYAKATTTGTTRVPYRSRENLLIESAYQAKKKCVELVDAKNTVYVVSFKEMKDYAKTDPTDSVRIMRKQMVADWTTSITYLPESWEPHDEGQFVKRVALLKASPEYRSVEDTMTQNAGRTFTILSIERIQNPELYKQYLAKKTQMNIQNEGTPLEKILWHGTSVDTVDDINLYGFNRSFCGKNATNYGQGVYFAVRSCYSMHDTYSTQDFSGRKHMYQCKVLVGHSTQGSSGMKVLPKRDVKVRFDSATDRVSNPDMYIIFSDTQAYPEYLVTFQW